MNRPQVDIVLPVYNEYGTLASLINSWHIAMGPILHRFVVCEDGSTDGTKKLVTKLSRVYPIKAVMQTRRIGYGLAIRAGLHVVRAPFVLCVDADEQYDPRDFAKFWKQRTFGGLCIGWRQVRRDPIIRRFLSKLFGYYFKALFPTNLRDPSCPFVLMPLSIAKHLCNAPHFLPEGFWWGCIGYLLKTHHKVMEIPIRHLPRVNGKSRVYTLTSFPSIVVNNTVALFRLRFMT